MDPNWIEGALMFLVPDDLKMANGNDNSRTVLEDLAAGSQPVSKEL